MSSTRVAPPPTLEPREWALAGLLALAFAPALLAQAEVWARVDYQSHGFLVPLVAAWAAHRERGRLARLPREGSPAGLVVLGLALAGYAAGLAAGLVALQGLALVAAVAGAVLFARGAAWLRALAFPVGFLVFMVPVPPAWMGPLVVRLQTAVTEAAVTTLRGLGVGAAREGNVLRLPEGDALFVAEACSGVTSVVTLAPLAVLLGYFTLRRTTARVALVLAVVPLAMAGNLARVVTTALAAERWGAERATQGLLHESAGLLTYAVACGLMLAVGAALRRLERGAGAA